MRRYRQSSTVDLHIEAPTPPPPVLDITSMAWPPSDHAGTNRQELARRCHDRDHRRLTRIALQHLMEQMHITSCIDKPLAKRPPELESGLTGEHQHRCRSLDTDASASACVERTPANFANVFGVIPRIPEVPTSATLREIAMRCEPNSSRKGKGEQFRRARLATASREHVADHVLAARGMSAPTQTASRIVPTAKGYVVLAPFGATSASDERIAAMLQTGVALNPFGRHRAPTAEFIISLKDGENPSIPYMQYITERVAIAIGRDPNRHIAAYVHSPDRHAGLGADGRPIQYHVHISVGTFDPITGEHWRCPHLHIVAQRELAAINLERGLPSICSPAIAGGRALGRLAASDRLTCILENSNGITREVPLDSKDLIAAKARLAVPPTITQEPAAGLIVTRPRACESQTAQRTAVKQAIMCRQALSSILADRSSNTISSSASTWVASLSPGHKARVTGTSVSSVRAAALAVAGGDLERAAALLYERTADAENIAAINCRYGSGNTPGGTP